VQVLEGLGLAGKRVANKRVPDRSMLQSVQRAAAVMNEIARHRQPVSIAELASTLRLERTIVHRIIRTLEGEDLVEAVTGGYSMGPRALLFGNAYLDTLNVRGVALPYLVDLLERVIQGKPWTASLMIRVHNEMMLIESVYNTAAPLDIQLSMGNRFPIDKSAAGRAMMAYMSPEQVVDLVGEQVAKERAKEFDEIREAGGMSFLQGIYGDLSGMCAIVFDRSKTPVAGVLIGGVELEHELTPESPTARALRRTADAIARALG
jgi:DNA-binding IclR family transcriptional regulator